MAERRRRSIPVRGPGYDDDEGDDDLVGPRMQAPRLRRRRGPAGERESLRTLVRDIPNFVKLLGRLAKDPRVSAADKAIVLAAIAYLFIPADVIPDWIPALGEVEDVFLLALALSRLLNNAGIDVLMDHWDGDVASLETALAALDRASSFLPEPVRGLLGRRR
ncbi:MAG TPA: YkvA family protein [Longimicrobium sp.]